MSRRRKKNRTDQVAQENRNISREKELMNRPINPGDPLVKALLNDLATASNSEALDIALKIQQFIRGDASLLSRPESGPQISKLKEKAHNMDKAEEAYNRDKERFMEEVINSAPKLTEAQRAKKIAEGKAIFEQARTMASAVQATKKLRFREKLTKEPKETISVAGIERTVKMGNSSHKVIEPEVIQIMDMQWVLKPGIHEVPRTVAELYRQRKQTQMENMQRESALREYKEMSTLQKQLDAIGSSFGSGGEKLQINGGL